MTSVSANAKATIAACPNRKSHTADVAADTKADSEEILKTKAQMSQVAQQAMPTGQ